MAIETLASHVASALEFKNSFTQLWFGFGREEPWDDEDVPPVENIYTTSLDTPIGFKKIDKAILVVPDTANEDYDENNTLPIPPDDNNMSITYKKQNWIPVSEEDAYKYGARYVYLETNLFPDDLPPFVYRQTGVYKNLSSNLSDTSKMVLRPSEVKTPGTLLEYENIRYHRYDQDDALKMQVVFKF